MAKKKKKKSTRSVKPARAIANRKKRKRKIPKHQLKLRNLQLSDYEDVKEIMEHVYKEMGGAWSKREFSAQISRFPEGQICIEDKGKVVAGALSLIVDYAKVTGKHTYSEITGGGIFATHNPNSDTLYGIDLFVHPKYQGLRLGRRLYDARKELCENLNLRAIVTGGRIPGYEEHADKMSPARYIEMIKNKEIHDPTLSFQLANDFHVRKILKDYNPEDTESSSYATLLEWVNIDYEEKEKLIGRKKAVVRAGIVQWQMRPVDSLEDLMQQVGFFVDTLASYNSDFILFPEFFNAPLMAQFNDQSPADAMRSLADYTIQIREKLTEMAISYNTNIIAGSMPEYRRNKLYNVSYLCRRDGTYDMQYKLHITPDERSYWGVQGGDELRIFETDVGKIGILVCYDVEFPEITRILAQKGLDILFVPYWTDTKKRLSAR